METKKQILNVKDLEKYSYSILPWEIRTYFNAGANAGITAIENEKAFQTHLIRPRVLRGVGEVSLATTIQGHSISMPICIAPTSLQCLAHPEGEKATARAATSSDTCMCLSTTSTFSLKEVAESGGGGLKWFQLSIISDRELTLKMIRNAEKFGYKGLVITVDVPIIGRKYEMTRNDFELPGKLCLANFEENEIAKPGFQDAYTTNLDKFSTWDSIHEIMHITDLPVILKGIQTGEDAKLALETGVQGIWVSNHGGRQLDTVVPTIDVLSEIVGAVDLNRIEVYIDGGIRFGTDVFKALAMGPGLCLWGDLPSGGWYTTARKAWG